MRYVSRGLASPSNIRDRASPWHLSKRRPDNLVRPLDGQINLPDIDISGLVSQGGWKEQMAAFFVKYAAPSYYDEYQVFTATAEFISSTKDMFKKWFEMIRKWVVAAYNTIKEKMQQWAVTIKTAALALMEAIRQGVVRIVDMFSTFKLLGVPRTTDMALVEAEVMTVVETPPANLESQSLDTSVLAKMSSGGLMSLMTGLVCALSFLGVDKNSSGSDISSRFMRCSSMLKAHGSSFVDLSKKLANYIHYAFTGKDAFVEFECEKEFTTVTQQLTKKLQDIEVLANVPYEMQRDISDLYIRMERVYPALLLSANIGPNVTKIYTFLKNKANPWASNHKGSSRMKPVVICLSGGSATGKTMTQKGLIDHVPKIVYRLLSADELRRDLPIYASHARRASSLSVNCMGEKCEFDDGYMDPLFYCFEEYQTSKLVEVKTQWANHFMKCCDDQPLMLNMAFEKGQKHFNSPFVIATGNFEEHHKPVEDPRAYQRRIEFDFKVVRGTVPNGEQYNPYEHARFIPTQDMISIITSPVTPSLALQKVFNAYRITSSKAFSYTQVAYMVSMVYIERIYLYSIQHADKLFVDDTEFLENCFKLSHLDTVQVPDGVGVFVSCIKEARAMQKAPLISFFEENLVTPMTKSWERTFHKCSEAFSTIYEKLNTSLVEPEVQVLSDVDGKKKERLGVQSLTVLMRQMTEGVEKVAEDIKVGSNAALKDMVHKLDSLKIESQSGNTVGIPNVDSKGEPLSREQLSARCDLIFHFAKELANLTNPRLSGWQCMKASRGGLLELLRHEVYRKDVLMLDWFPQPLNPGNPWYYFLEFEDAAATFRNWRSTRTLPSNRSEMSQRDWSNYKRFFSLMYKAWHQCYQCIINMPKKNVTPAIDQQCWRESVPHMRAAQYGDFRADFRRLYPGMDISTRGNIMKTSMQNQVAYKKRVNANNARNNTKPPKGDKAVPGGYVTNSEQKRRDNAQNKRGEIRRNNARKVKLESQGGGPQDQILANVDNRVYLEGESTRRDYAWLGMIADLGLMDLKEAIAYANHQTLEEFLKTVVDWDDAEFIEVYYHTWDDNIGVYSYCICGWDSFGMDVDTHLWRVPDLRTEEVTYHDELGYIITPKLESSDEDIFSFESQGGGVFGSRLCAKMNIYEYIAKACAERARAVYNTQICLSSGHTRPDGAPSLAWRIAADNYLKRGYKILSTKYKYNKIIIDSYDLSSDNNVYALIAELLMANDYFDDRIRVCIDLFTCAAYTMSFYSNRKFGGVLREIVAKFCENFLNGDCPHNVEFLIVQSAGEVDNYRIDMGDIELDLFRDILSPLANPNRAEYVAKCKKANAKMTEDEIDRQVTEVLHTVYSVLPPLLGIPISDEMNTEFEDKGWNWTSVLVEVGIATGVLTLLVGSLATLIVGLKRMFRRTTMSDELEIREEEIILENKKQELRAQTARTQNTSTADRFNIERVIRSRQDKSKLSAQMGTTSAAANKIKQNQYAILTINCLTADLLFLEGSTAVLNSHVWDAMPETFTLVPYIPMTNVHLHVVNKRSCVLLENDVDTDFAFVSIPNVRQHARIIKHIITLDELDHFVSGSSGMISTFVGGDVAAPSMDVVEDLCSHNRPVPVSNRLRGYTLPRFISYKWRGAVKSACGSVLYGAVKGVAKLIGIHTAGKTETAIGVSTPLTYENCYRFSTLNPSPHPAMAQLSISATIALQDEGEAYNFDLTSHCMVTPHITQATDSTTFVPTVFTTARFNDVDPPKIPANLTHEAYLNALKKEQLIYPVNYSQCVVDAVDEYKEEIVNILFAGCNITGCRSLSVQEALGSYGDLKRFDKQTSKGLRLRSLNLSKSSILTEEGEDYEKFCVFMEHRIEKMRAGEFEYQINFDKLKDELRDPERVALKKTRVFKITDFVDNVQMKMAWGDVVSRTKFLHWVSPMACGIDPGSSEWRLIWMLFRGEKVVCTDISGFESTVSTFIIPIFEYIASICFDDPFDRLFAVYVLVATLYAIRFNRGKGFILGWQNTSGNWLTTFINTITNFLYFTSSIIVRCKIEGEDPIIALRELKIKLYSDDNLVALRRHWFTPQFVIDSFKNHFNVTVTATDKSDNIEFLTIEECDFLSRGFRMEKGQVFCPLAYESLISQLYFVRCPKGEKANSAFILGQLQQNLDNVARELREYPSNEAAVIARKIVDFLRKNKLRCRFNYDSMNDPVHTKLLLQ